LNLKIAVFKTISAVSRNYFPLKPEILQDNNGKLWAHCELIKTYCRIFLLLSIRNSDTGKGFGEPIFLSEPHAFVLLMDPLLFSLVE